jgi:hypothetical protein
MSLGGMLVAGGAMGLRTASNANVQAQNDLELDQAREALREQFHSQRYQQARADAKENFQSQALLNQARYEQQRGDKLTDAELKHKQSMALEDRKDKRSAASNATRLQSALLRKESGGSGGSKGNVTLADGTEFTPRSSEFKVAADMVDTGLAKTIPEAYQIMISKGLISQAAQNPMSYKEGSVSVAKDMVTNLFSNDVVPNKEKVRSFNPKTGKFE